MEILLSIIIFFLFLIYRKINAYIQAQEENDVNDGYGEKRPQWLKDICYYLKSIDWKLDPISDFYLSENPAGPKSDKFKKKANLVKVYADYLVKTEKLPIEEARIRSDFEINEIYKYEIDELIDRINGGVFDWGNSWTKDEEKKAKDNFYKSNILEKDIEKKANPKDASRKIIPHDLFSPLYSLIVKDEYEAGKEIELSTTDEVESVKRYDDFVENRAIVTILEKLKIIRKTNKDGWEGRPKFVLTTSNLDDLRTLIYGKGNASHDNGYFEEKYREGELHRLFETSIF